MRRAADTLLCYTVEGLSGAPWAGSTAQRVVRRHSVRRYQQSTACSCSSPRPVRDELLKLQCSLTSNAMPPILPSLMDAAAERDVNSVSLRVL